MEQRLKELVTQYQEARTQRLTFEKAAKALQTNKEEPLKAEILTLMSGAGVKSVNFEGFGTLVRKDLERVELHDIEALLSYMYDKMTSARQAGLPLTSALLLQRRVGKEAVLGMLEGDADASCEKLGVRIVEEPNITFTARSK